MKIADSFKQIKRSNDTTQYLSDVGIILVDTTWTLWNSWTACNQICDTGTKYRDRQCAGSNPLGTINKPAKTPQYGGERDCAGDSREQPNCNTHSCSRKKKRYVDE